MHSTRNELLLKVTLTLLTILTYANGFGRKCPDSSQWKFTSRSYGCSDQKVYLCLVNGLKSKAAVTVFSESCGPEDVSREGFRYKFNPNLDQVPCSVSQYQPFTFTTNGNSQCVLRKSLCNDRGQVSANNGSTITDRSCRCDYRQNYDYVIPPKDPCSCKPAEEDCSCYKRKCVDDKIMLGDYSCLKLKEGETFLSEDIKCPIISSARSTVETMNNSTFVETKENSSTLAGEALNRIVVFMLVTVGLILMLLISLNLKVPPFITKTIGKSQKDRLIFKDNGTPEMCHVIEGDDFTIECEMRSLLPVKYVRWQKNECDINVQVGKYIFNDSYLLLKIKNLCKDDTGTYKCIVSSWLGLNNASVDICISYLSSLNTRMTWIRTLHTFQACSKEDDNGINITVHELPKEYKCERKTQGDIVTMKPAIYDDKETIKSLPEDIKCVIWFYKNADKLRVVKPAQHGGINIEGINDRIVKLGPHPYIDDGSVKQSSHGYTNAGVEKWSPHDDIKLGPFGDKNDGDVKQDQHEALNKGVLKQGLHGDTNDGVVKEGQHCDINDGAIKRDKHTEIVNAAVKLDQHCCIKDEGTQNKHALVFNTAVSNNGQYVCFVATNGNIISEGWKLEVILQGSVFKEVMKHRKDNFYVKTAPEEKAIKSLENNGFVLIVGREGTGKSKISMELASFFEQKGYHPFAVDQKSLRTTQTADLKSSRVMFIIDHSVYNPNELSQILDQLPEVSNISHARIIFTCRHLQLMTRNILQRYNLYNETALIELDNILTVDEKKNILEVHMKVNNITQSKDTELLEILKSKVCVLSEDVITEIIKTEPFWGFPLMASKFCSKTENLKKGEKYFTHPPKFLVDDIHDLYQYALKTKDPELMQEYLILVYLATDKRQCFDVSVCSVEGLFQLHVLMYGKTKEVEPFEVGSIKDAADRLVAKNKYIINCDDHAYRFIHPYVSKAIFFSSKNLINLFIQNGDVEDLIEFVRSFWYTFTDDELVLRLENEDMYYILCERLSFSIINNSGLEKKIGHYIYDCFIKIRDTIFLNALLQKLVCLSSFNYRKTQNNSSAPSTQVNMIKGMNGKDDTQTAMNVNKAQLDDEYDNRNQYRFEEAPVMITLYSPAQMITMIEHLTRTGKDSWIYNQTISDVPDFVVLYGLIVGCKNKFLSDTEQAKTFNNILNMFTNNLKNTNFRLSCCTPMDTYDNTFCHFLTLFNETESCLILNRLIEGLYGHAMGHIIVHKKTAQKKTERNIILKVKNIFEESPLKMAAYLGKPKLFTLFSSETKMNKQKKKKLFEVVKNGMNVAFITMNFTNLNVDHHFKNSICVGDKKAYDEIMTAITN